jgi:glycosyltransferase involved in cell wall biosynthesis
VKRDLLLITPDFPPGAGGIQTLLHGLALSVQRYTPEVVTLGFGEEGAFDRVQPFRLDRVRRPRRLRPAHIVALNACGLGLALKRRPAAVLSGHIVTGPAALTVRALRGVPVVQYVHAEELRRRPRLARTVLSRVDAVIAVSRHSQSLVRALGVSHRRVYVVNPGVDEPGLDVAPSDRDPAIIVISRLDERYKGHDVLLRSLPLIRRRVPDVHLHVVGDGLLRGYLESLARGLAVADVVSFHGRVSDEKRDELMRTSSVFAMLSRVDAGGAGEGFGIAYMEAGRFGLPVVAGGVAGALDAVVDGETGLLVDPHDHVATADAISSLLCQPALASRLGAAGRERARSFSWQRTAAAVEDVLDLVSAK